MNEPSFQNYAMPLVRRVFPSMLDIRTIKNHKGYISFNSGIIQKPERTIGLDDKISGLSITGVAPLSQPLGLAYALRWKYDEGSLNEQ